MYTSRFKGYVKEEGISFRTDAREVGFEHGDRAFVEVGNADDGEGDFTYLHFGVGLETFLAAKTVVIGNGEKAVEIVTDIDKETLVKALRYAADTVEKQAREE